jgi:serine/threonine-protein kinase
VYQAAPATCAANRADYALKVLRSENNQDSVAVGMLRREARLGARVSHPNLAAILAAHVESPPYYVVMPYLGGATLRSILRETMLHPPAALRLPQVLWVVRQTAEALAALHETGWLHCDVKPENIQVAHTGHTTLLDLGLAQPIAASHTRAEFAGTPNYAAPEWFSRTTQAGLTSDVYSLGVTLFEILTGKLPRPPLAPGTQCDWQSRAPNPRRSRPELPIQVTRLIERMLAVEPLRRPLAEELIGTLIDLEIEFLDEWMLSGELRVESGELRGVEGGERTVKRVEA